MNEDPIVKISPFPQGMNNVQKESKLPEGSLRSAINVDITDDGSVKRRNKFSKIYTGTDISSLYKRYFVESGVLKYLEIDNTSTIVNNNIKSGDIYYCDLNNQIYYTDGTDIYDGTHNKIGLPTPSFFTLSSTVGSLLSGKYLVSICYMETATGILSGATSIKEINVTAGGISLTNISQLAGCTVNIYVSDTNGSVLYYQMNTSSTSASISLTSKNKHEVQTLNMSPLTGGDIIQAYNGRLYVANESVLWYSQPMRYGLNKSSSDFYYFADTITIVQPVDDGIYVVADKTYFIKGNDPSKAEILEISNLKGIKGTGVTLDASYFDLQKEVYGNVAYWFSTQGGVIGILGGQIQEFSKDKLAVPDNLQAGTTLYDENDSIHKLVTSMSVLNKSSLNSVGASDNATAVIIRNGVII